VPPDFTAKRPSLLVRNASGNAARRNAPWLQENHRSVGRQGRANARRLSGARRRGDNHRPRLANPRNDLGNEGIYRQREHEGILYSDFYSLSAATGFNLIARRAGTRLAISATAIRSTPTAANVITSRVLIP
jgi:hypothetical protein